MENWLYVEIIQKLFKYTSSSSRHTNNEKGQNSVFTSRKCFFQSKLGTWLTDHAFFIHVAGTKGKGSICEYIRLGCMQLKTLESFPLKVGVFTSPHMHTSRERIKINTSLIPKRVSTCNTQKYDITYCYQW